MSNVSSYLCHLAGTRYLWQEGWEVERKRGREGEEEGGRVEGQERGEMD